MLRRKTDPPRGVLKTGVSDTLGLRHQRFHPSDDLVNYVEHYWMVEWDLRDREPHRVETLPHPSVHMTFEHEGESRIGGPSTARFSRVLTGKGGVLAAKFTPAGFYAFARVPVSKFANKTVKLSDVFGSAGDDLGRAVFSETSDLARISLIEDFLRAYGPKPDANVPRLSEIVYSVANDREIIKVEDIVDRWAMNKRTLQRMFAKYVGVSPKWIIRRYRLHEAAEQLAAGDASSHIDLALELGYSDQAHFVRDFKEIVGVPPGAYARAIQD